MSLVISGDIMEKKITNRIVKGNKGKEFIIEDIYKKMSELLNLDIDIIRACGEKAFRAWENIEDKKITTIFTMDPKQRELEARKMHNIFSEYIDPFMLLEHRNPVTVEILHDGFKALFS